MADLVQYYGTGRRKSSVARVFLRPGSGQFTVNGRKFAEYFVTEAQRSAGCALSAARIDVESRAHGAEVHLSLDVEAEKRTVPKLHLSDRHCLDSGDRTVEAKAR